MGSAKKVIQVAGMTTPEEKTIEEEVKAKLHKQGTPGRNKNARINMSFTPELYDFIHTMSRIKGISITQYVNTVLTKEMKLNGDLYQKAQELLQTED